MNRSSNIKIVNIYAAKSGTNTIALDRIDNYRLLIIFPLQGAGKKNMVLSGDAMKEMARQAKATREERRSGLDNRHKWIIAKVTYRRIAVCVLIIHSQSDFMQIIRISW